MSYVTPFIFILTCFCSMAHAEWHGKIINIIAHNEISRTEFIEQIAVNNILVLGEKHYTYEVQNEEGKIIYDVVTSSKRKEQFSTSWEFLNASSQLKTISLFNQVKNNEITSSDFLVQTQGTEKSSVYAPIIDVTAELGGLLFGINLSREEKAPVVEYGLESLDPKLLPPNFILGGSKYFDRFNEVMKDHASPEQIRNYFAAQSLLDDVSAYHLSIDSTFPLKFLIIGSFHSQFNDGVIERIRERNIFSKIVNIEIIDSSDYSLNELALLSIDQKYGARADYIVFVNEPIN